MSIYREIEREIMIMIEYSMLHQIALREARPAPEVGTKFSIISISIIICINTSLWLITIIIIIIVIIIVITIISSSSSSNIISFIITIVITPSPPIKSFPIKSP